MALPHDDTGSRPIGPATTTITFNSIAFTIVSDSGPEQAVDVKETKDAEGQTDGSFGVKGALTRKFTVQEPASETTKVDEGDESASFDSSVWIATKVTRNAEAGEQRFIDIETIKKYN